MRFSANESTEERANLFLLHNFFVPTRAQQAEEALSCLSPRGAKHALPLPPLCIRSSRERESPHSFEQERERKESLSLAADSINLVGRKRRKKKKKTRKSC